MSPYKQAEGNDISVHRSGPCKDCPDKFGCRYFIATHRAGPPAVREEKYRCRLSVKDNVSER